LPPFPWPVAQLPPLPILSLDPSDRIEVAFGEADVPLNTLRTQKDIVDPHQHNLIKLGGDPASRNGLLLNWAKVRDAPNQPDKVHLLKEAGRVAGGGVVLIFADDPGERFPQLWNELVRARASGAKHGFALGPSRGRWPKGVRHRSEDVSGVLAWLTELETPPPAPPAFEAPSTPTELLRIHEKLDRLLDGQEGLREGQEAIYGRLEATHREIVARVLAGVQSARLDDVKVQRELHGTLKAIRRALIRLQTQQLPDLSSDLKQTLDEVTEILRADVDLRTAWS
jgi:hypothetical protein